MTLGGTNRSLLAGVPGTSCFCKRKVTEKGMSAGTPAGCPRDTRPSRGLPEVLCDFPYVPFLLPKMRSLWTEMFNLFGHMKEDWQK